MTFENAAECLQHLERFGTLLDVLEAGGMNINLQKTEAMITIHGRNQNILQRQCSQRTANGFFSEDSTTTHDIPYSFDFTLWILGNPTFIWQSSTGDPAATHELQPNGLQTTLVLASTEKRTLNSV